MWLVVIILERCMSQATFEGLISVEETTKRRTVFGENKIWLLNWLKTV